MKICFPSWKVQLSPMAAATACSISSLSSSSSTTTATIRAGGPICPFPVYNSFRLNLVSSSTFKLSRLRISQKIGIVPMHVFRVPIVSCLGDDQSEAPSESAPASATNVSKTEATVDLKLPRRSLLVHFTCNACGERTQRLINRLAYERGAVFVQCAGCFRHHKLVDNLGLVVEYDFREENGVDANSDPV